MKIRWVLIVLSGLLIGCLLPRTSVGDDPFRSGFLQDGLAEQAIQPELRRELGVVAQQRRREHACERVSADDPIEPSLMDESREVPHPGFPGTADEFRGKLGVKVGIFVDI